MHLSDCCVHLLNFKYNCENLWKKLPDHDFAAGAMRGSGGQLWSHLGIIGSIPLVCHGWQQPVLLARASLIPSGTFAWYSRIALYLVSKHRSKMFFHSHLFHPVSVSCPIPCSNLTFKVFLEWANLGDRWDLFCPGLAILRKSWRQASLWIKSSCSKPMCQRLATNGTNCWLAQWCVCWRRQRRRLSCEKKSPGSSSRPGLYMSGWAAILPLLPSCHLANLAILPILPSCHPAYPVKWSRPSCFAVADILPLHKEILI